MACLDLLLSLLFPPTLQLSADDKFSSYMDLTLQLANTQVRLMLAEVLDVLSVLIAHGQLQGCADRLQFGLMFGQHPEKWHPYCIDGSARALQAVEVGCVMTACPVEADRCNFLVGHACFLCMWC